MLWKITPYGIAIDFVQFNVVNFKEISNLVFQTCVDENLRRIWFSLGVIDVTVSQSGQRFNFHSF